MAENGPHSISNALILQLRITFALARDKHKNFLQISGDFESRWFLMRLLFFQASQCEMGIYIKEKTSMPGFLPLQ